MTSAKSCQSASVALSNCADVLGGDVGVYSAAEMLLRFIESIREPLVPFLPPPTTELDREHLQTLPKNNRTTIRYLHHFIAHLLLPCNPGLRIRDLATVFGRVLFGPREGDRARTPNPDETAAALHLFRTQSF